MAFGGSGSAHINEITSSLVSTQY